MTWVGRHAQSEVTSDLFSETNRSQKTHTAAMARVRPLPKQRPRKCPTTNRIMWSSHQLLQGDSRRRPESKFQHSCQWNKDCDVVSNSNTGSQHTSTTSVSTASTDAKHAIPFGYSKRNSITWGNASREGACPAYPKCASHPHRW